jgi:menaquinol-cytochrome c reductase iron-sulfur subunit
LKWFRIALLDGYIIPHLLSQEHFLIYAVLIIVNDINKVTNAASRRSFVKGLLCAFIGGLLGLIPFASGIVVFMDPMRRKSSSNGAVRVASLESLPSDGIPRKFSVLATRVDAWNKFKDVPIGAVYLRRTGNQVEALNVVCPHAGCFVDFSPARGRFQCPCHNSSFTVTGKIDNPASPSPRGLDTLDVEIRDGKEIWVNFRNFQAGRADKIPVS